MTFSLETIGTLLTGMFTTIVNSLGHNGWVLALSIITAVVLKTYVNSDKLGQFLTGRARVSIFLSVAVGAFTPFCACGTMAVIVGMLTTALPWGPIMAFLTSSPLMSPDGFLMLSGMISLRFAVALTLASLMIGVFSGFATQWIERHTGYLRGQARFLGEMRNAACACESGNQAPSAAQQACACRSKDREPIAVGAACACVSKKKVRISAQPACACNREIQPLIPAAAATACDCNASKPEAVADGAACDEGSQPGIQTANGGACCAALPNRNGSIARLMVKGRLAELLKNFVDLGLRQILFNFCLFIGIGYLVNTFVPASIVSALFGANSAGAVPLASLIGLPLYLTTESSIPLIQSMLRSGASEGAMLAFIITGSATSAWVIAGLTTFMKKRALALYVAFIMLGGILSGYLYDLLLTLL